MAEQNIIKRINSMKKALLDAQYEATLASTEIEDIDYAANSLGEENEAIAILDQAQAHIDTAMKLCNQAKACVNGSGDATGDLQSNLRSYRQVARRTFFKE